MAKTFMNVHANGCHHNISLWQGEENMFLPDGDNPRLPSKLGLNAIGGVLEHLAALTCITAPTVNSYRRVFATPPRVPPFPPPRQPATRLQPRGEAPRTVAFPPTSRTRHPRPAH